MTKRLVKKLIRKVLVNRMMVRLTGEHLLNSDGAVDVVDVVVDDDDDDDGGSADDDDEGDDNND